MKVTQEIKHQLIPFGYLIETKLQHDFKQGELCLFANSIILNFNDIIFSKQELLNLKGRDRLNILAPELKLPAPQHEELFFINGFYSSNSPENNFQFSIESEFFSFPDTHHISYKLKPHRTGLANWLDLSLLAWLAPITITGFRLGIESFKSKRFSSLFGFVPVVNERLLIEATQTHVRIIIFSEGFSSKSEPQMQNMNICTRLKTALSQAFNFNL